MYVLLLDCLFIKIFSVEMKDNIGNTGTFEVLE